MKLSELMMPFHDAISRGNLDVEVIGLADDSRSVKPGMLFIAVKGTKTDGHEYLDAAAAAGAAGLVVESGLAGAKIPAGELPVIEVPNSRRFLGVLASRFYGYPAARLKMIGVTGTNGKTTTTYVCKAILEAAGKRLGLIGTVSY